MWISIAIPPNAKRVQHHAERVTGVWAVGPAYENNPPGLYSVTHVPTGRSVKVADPVTARMVFTRLVELLPQWGADMTEQQAATYRATSPGADVILDVTRAGLDAVDWRRPWWSRVPCRTSVLDRALAFKNLEELKHEMSVESPLIHRRFTQDLYHGELQQTFELCCACLQDHGDVPSVVQQNLHDLRREMTEWD